MSDQEFLKSVLFHRKLEDGPWAGKYILVLDMIYNHRIVIAEWGSVWYERPFCFRKEGKPAIEAAQVWNGEGDPPGPWIKDVEEGRYGPGSKK
jgi:hypothetical protein